MLTLFVLSQPNTQRQLNNVLKYYFQLSFSMNKKRRSLSVSLLQSFILKAEGCNFCDDSGVKQEFLKTKIVFKQISWTVPQSAIGLIDRYCSPASEWLWLAGLDV